MVDQFSTFEELVDYLKKLKNQVEQNWDFKHCLERGLPPLPKWDIECPFCKNKVISIKHFSVFKRSTVGHLEEYRVDVCFKCLNPRCCMVWACGLPITKELFEKLPKGTKDWTQYGHVIYVNGRWIWCSVDFEKCEYLTS